jgi:hypothetical protein
MGEQMTGRIVRSSFGLALALAMLLAGGTSGQMPAGFELALVGVDVNADCRFGGKPLQAHYANPREARDAPKRPPINGRQIGSVGMNRTDSRLKYVRYFEEARRPDRHHA